MSSTTISTLRKQSQIWAPESTDPPVRSRDSARRPRATLDSQSVAKLIDKDIDRILALLRSRIRTRGFTQLEVQEILGWGRSYISQLLTQQKAIRIDQILLILNAINVDPAEFWGEVFQFGQFSEQRPARPQRHRAATTSPFPDGDDFESGLRRIRLLYGAVVRVLERKNLITAEALEAAIARAEDQKG